MSRRVDWVFGSLLLSALACAESPVIDVGPALAIEVGEQIVVADLLISRVAQRALTLERFEVYAPAARIYEATAAGLRELPRSDWRHFRAVPESPGAARLALSIAPDGRQAQGVLLTAMGQTYVLVGSDAGEGLRLRVRNARQDADGKEAIFVCEHGAHLQQRPSDPPNASGSVGAPLPDGASRSAVVAVDTDNELLQQKFGDSTGAATTYLAQLFAGLNVIYERDFDLTLLQGTTILRTSGTPDPYPSPVGTGTLAQLTEFGTFWQTNQSAVNRAFAMLLSGKSADDFRSSGIAWVLNGSNYCTSRNADGGHYSVTQVFKFDQSNASDDMLVIAHELGHNFGAFHTHCSNSTTGAGPTATNTIDTCFTGEPGCFNGTPVCPVASTVNGVANVRGTLMAYCHLNGIGGCTSSEVFANAHRTLLTPRMANNVNNGCFTGAQTPLIFANGFEPSAR